MPEATVVAPDIVRVQQSTTDRWQEARLSPISLEIAPAGRGLCIDVTSAAEVSRVLLRWRRRCEPDALVLGDAWERSYGDLEWRGFRPERPLPWTAIIHSRTTQSTVAYGVEVRGGAFASWQVDSHGLTLVLDLRCGGVGVRPGDRMIHAATIRAVDGEASPFATQKALAGLQCRDSASVELPIVGANNWYHAYGRNFDQKAVVRDARTIAELTGRPPHRPFGVIDDGWSAAGTGDGRPASAGPWDRGRAPAFPDMSEAASAIAAEGVRPGIWFRPLLRRSPVSSATLGPRDGAFALDPSSPTTLDLVAEDVARFTSWGFELLKYDFSTYDVLGKWGPKMGPSPADDGWALADPTVTTAEALVGFYRRLKESAGAAVVLGCNVVGHLAAGFVDANRIGDDTSGRDWDRTRRVGVNTLAFRLAQHGCFFAVDADCVPSTPATDWSKNRQFLDLIARSGTVLFVSIDPATRSDAVDADLSTALRRALAGGDPGGVEPLDWLDSPVPELWRSGTGTVTYSWVEELGADASEPYRGQMPG